MKIINKRKDGSLSELSEFESGTLVKYGDVQSHVYGYGIILKDVDNENTIIYDLEDNVYYSDHELYKVYEVCDGAITIE